MLKEKEKISFLPFKTHLLKINQYSFYDSIFLHDFPPITLLFYIFFGKIKIKLKTAVFNFDIYFVQHNIRIFVSDTRKVAKTTTQYINHVSNEME